MKQRKLIHLAAALGLALAPLAQAQDATAPATPLLHSMFQDHAVLQRDQPLRVWGRAEPGVQVQVEIAGKRARVRAGGDGYWEASLPAMKAGGPYVLTARAGQASQRVSDVMVGDVWLCSGQSNMELQVWRSLDARAELAGAGNDRIRLLTVPQVAQVEPQREFTQPVAWKPVDTESVRDFSAACYFFARELQKTVDVPMGLVNASWGGSKIQPWISADGLKALSWYDGELGVLDTYGKDELAGLGQWGSFWQDWWSRAAGSEAAEQPWTGEGGGWTPAPAQLGPWEHWGVPALADYNGMVWYRTTVTLSEAQAAQDAVLELGPADEVDMTWVNGQAVGSTYGAGGGREYRLPPGLLKPGRNTVVVNVLDTYREGGLSGPASIHAVRLADGTRLQLDARWSYRIAPAGIAEPPRAPWQSAAGMTTLYNGMIAPLGRHGFKGALWYQGESNTGEPERYADLLRALRDDWRRQFGKDLGFLVVQLANYGPAPTRPTESGWAGVREAQRLVAAEDARSGLAVAIDIGDRYDIHPANKQQVGKRLARAARKAVYGERIAASGPVPRSAKREGEAVVVEFGDATGGLVAYSAEFPIGFELCGADAGSCQYARAEIRGDRVALQASNAAQATRVRYCWADSPVCTLFDADGMPAGPFEIPVAPQAK
mgnify:CR=1 FL=1